MYIKQLKLSGIGIINELELNFNQGINLICGENGVGKTTILDTIVALNSQFFGSKIKRNAAYEEGYAIGHVVFGSQSKKIKISTKNFHPLEIRLQANREEEFLKKLIVFKTDRNFEYTLLKSLARDKNKDTTAFEKEASEGVDYSDLKNWFAQRHLWSAHPESLTKEEIYNFTLAKSIFGLLSPDFEFLKVLASTYDIILKKNDIEIYYEYLSSGFKSCVVMLMGLIKEIDLRFKSSGITASNFDGIVLIDEADLHLHPEWQAKFLKLLKVIFPLTQFIITTHSPHMLQVASLDEIIPLQNENGNVILKDIPAGQYGLVGWSIEEILKDVMGMQSVVSEEYLKAITNFNNSIEEENTEDAKLYWEKLDEMIHPNSEKRKLLKIQMASIGVEV